jgi:hypothetical protein
MKRYLTALAASVGLMLAAGPGTASAGDLLSPVLSPSPSQQNAAAQQQVQVVPVAPQVGVQNVNVLPLGDVEQGDANNANTGQAVQQENAAAGQGSYQGDGRSLAAGPSQQNAAAQQQVQVVPVAPQVSVQNVNVLPLGDVEQGDANNANTGQAVQQENDRVSGRHGEQGPKQCGQWCGPTHEPEPKPKPKPKPKPCAWDHGQKPCAPKPEPKPCSWHHGQNPCPPGHKPEPRPCPEHETKPCPPKHELKPCPPGHKPKPEPRPCPEQETKPCPQKHESKPCPPEPKPEPKPCPQKHESKPCPPKHESKPCPPEPKPEPRPRPPKHEPKPCPPSKPAQGHEPEQRNVSGQQQVQIVPIAPQLNVQNVNLLGLGAVSQGSANNANTGQAAQQSNNLLPGSLMGGDRR